MKILSYDGRVVTVDDKLLTVENGVHHEHGTVAFHTGTNSYAFSVPIENDSFDNYLIYAKATNLWKIVDGVWVDTGGRDFREVDTTGTNYVGGGFSVTYPTRTTSPIITGGGAEVGEGAIGGMARTGGPGGTSNPNVLVGTPVISGGFVTVNMPANHFVCKTLIGQTYEYDIWGWNNE